MADEAGLALVIDPTKALRELKRFESGVDSAANAVTGFARRVKSDFEIIGNAAGLVLRPLTALVGGMAAAKASMLALGAASVSAAGDYEMFTQQMRTVIRTKEEADRAFRESIDFSVVTPFTPDEIVRTRIELEAVGVRGSKAVKAVAEAAAAMNRNIGDVAAAVKSLETEPLRRLGVQLQRSGEEFVFTFRDRMGDAQKIVVEGFETAQEALLGIFDNKFDGGVQRMSVTLKGLTSTFKGAVTDLRATFGEGFLTEAKLFVSDLIEGAGTFKETARQAGIAFGDELGRARVTLLAGFDVALQVARQIGEVMQQEGGIGTVILEAMRLGAKVFGTAIVGAFQASLSLWRTIGTILGEGVLEALRMADIPLLSDAVRSRGVAGNLGAMSMSDLHRAARQLGVPTIYRGTETIAGSEEVNWYGEVSGPARIMNVAGQKPREQLIGDLKAAIRELPVEDQAPWARRDTARAVYESVEQAKASLTSNLDEVGSVAVAGLQTFANKIAAAAGQAPIDIVAALADAKKRIAGATGRTVGGWDATLNPAGSDASEPGGGLYPTLPMWAIHGAVRQARGMMIAGDVTGEYAKQLREEIELTTMSRQEADRLLVVRRADIEARKRQIDLGLKETDLLPEQKKELESLIDELHRAEKMRSIGDSIGDGFAQGFSRATMHAKNFGDALDYLGDAAMGVVDRILQIQIWEPMAQGISKSFTQMAAKKSAMGDVFAEGRLQAFGLGGVVNRPTLFGFTGGIGLMGEAGSEAIMPLRRTSSGRLGVEATGGPGGAMTLPTPVFNVTDATTSKTTVEATDVKYDGQRLLVGMVLKDRRNNGPMSRGIRK